MARYLAGRVALAIGGVWLVTTATFVALHVLPGNPFGNPHLAPGVRSNLIAHYGLNLPLRLQYVRYLHNLLRGRLGWSLVNPHRTVAAILAQGWPVSATLGLLTLAWSVPLGSLLGLAACRSRVGDAIVWAVSVTGLAVPNFVLAAGLGAVFAVRLPWLPVAGWGRPAQAVLPSLALGAAPLALVARLVRAQAGAVLTSEYVRGARAKGVAGWTLLRRHVLGPALLPVATALGPMVAALLVGSFVVEHTFAIPGLGRAFVQSVLDRDYPVVLGLTVFYAALLAVANLLSDLLAGVLDPRVRTAQLQRS